jgi:polyhydroxybutyrate depolymerase
VRAVVATIAAAAAIALVVLAVTAGAGSGSRAQVPRPAPRAHRAEVAPCVPAAPGTHRLAPIDGRVPVVIHVGRGAKAGAPLILGLPGAGQTARDFASYTGYSRLADQKGFSVAYPTATGARPFWNINDHVAGKPDDVAYLRRVIAAAVKYTCADAARVGVTGVSNGGGMSARLACDASDLIAAAAPVAGGYGSLPECHPSRPVPILEVHGVVDHVVPYAGKGGSRSGAVAAFLAQWRRLDRCGAAAQRTTLERNVTQLRWASCAGGAVVQHVRIEDADHGWPGEDDLAERSEFATTPRTWAFLSSFRRR